MGCGDSHGSITVLPLTCGAEGRQAMKNIGGPQACEGSTHIIIIQVLKRIERNGQQARGAIVVTLKL